MTLKRFHWHKDGMYESASGEYLDVRKAREVVGPAIFCLRTALKDSVTFGDLPKSLIYEGVLDRLTEAFPEDK